MKTTLSILLTLALLNLSACSIFDDNDSNDPVADNSGDDPDGTNTKTPNPLEPFAAQDRNSEALEITDATTLKTGISTAFGPASGTPLALQAGESLDAVIKRATGF